MSVPRAIPRDGIDAWLHDIEFLKEVASPSALDLGEVERRTLVPSDRVPVGPSGKELSHVIMALLKPRQHAIGAPDAVMEMPQVSFRDSVPPLVGDIAASAAWARTAGDPAVHGFEVLTKMRYNLLAKAYVLRAREVRAGFAARPLLAGARRRRRAANPFSRTWSPLITRVRPWRGRLARSLAGRGDPAARTPPHRILQWL